MYMHWIYKSSRVDLWNVWQVNCFLQ